MKKLNTHQKDSRESAQDELTRLNTIIDKIQKQLFVSYLDMAYFQLENTRKRLQKMQSRRMDIVAKGLCS